MAGDIAGGIEQVFPRDGHTVERAETQTRTGPFCGGGGFGSSLDRPAADVAFDAREKWISVRAAEQVYGVVLTAEGEADFAASEKLRATMSAAAS